MNFEEWYATMPKLNGEEIGIARISWNKCKEEVLKILNDKHNISTFGDDHGYTWKSIDYDVLEQIEKL